MKFSIVLPSFNRSKQLNYGLLSIQNQNIKMPFEVVVVNDGENDDTESVCKKYSSNMNVKYIWTKRTKDANGEFKWRTPSFSINIGVKQSVGEFVFLSCPEIFHVGKVLEPMVQVLNNNMRTRVIPSKGLKDHDATILNSLEASGGILNVDYRSIGSRIDTNFPYLMGFHRKFFYDMGGYDEDFIGVTGEDDDFIRRLWMVGVGSQAIESEIIHLWHPSVVYTPEQRNYNMKLFGERLQIVRRNVGKEWGKI